MKPELGVCYYPEHWPEDMWETDARQMREAGITWVRIGEFAWSRLEACEGVFTWDWLDRAITVLGDAGLKVVLGTPSATPPIWVLEKFPDMLAVDANGDPRKFGSRRHYCFAHLGYRAEAARMAGAMAKRYGRNPHIAAWQIDNEYGCHETTVSYSQAARVGFCDWLSQKYQSAEALNKSWGNVFWSMEYADIAQVDLPNLTVTEPNPAHVMDFRRFASDQVVAFNQAQVAAMRPHTDAAMIHNYMGRVTDFDHFDVGRDLEIASWDSYPLGFLEDVMEDDDAWKNRFCRQGDPDLQAFHHDLYRAVGKGRWWVMEQQPGPVNWAGYNPIPLDGMVRLWTWEAIAHGAEVVSYFRWRQAPFAQEQMHTGLRTPDNQPAQALKEAQQVAREISALGHVSYTDADVAIVFDYPSQWAWETQPQGRDFDYFRLVFEQYRALRRLGLSVDILPADTTSFGARKLVLIPALMTIPQTLKKAIDGFEGAVLMGPRTGSKTTTFSIPLAGVPNWDAVDVNVRRVGTLRPDVTVALDGGGVVKSWIEELVASDVIERTVDGAPILVGSTKRCYLGGWLDEQAMTRVVTMLAQTAGIKVTVMPEGVRMRDFGDKRLIVNYNDTATTVDGITVDGAGIAILDR